MPQRGSLCPLAGRTRPYRPLTRSVRRPGLALGLLLGAASRRPARPTPPGASGRGFGSAATRAESRLWAASRTRGALFAVAVDRPVAAAGWAAAAAGRALARVAPC